MISAIRLWNCQSWEDCVIHLATDRINIIQADNNVGKSVLFRLLKLAGDANYYDKSERESLIRWGAPWAKVLFQFTDGARAVMQIEKSKVLYAFLPTKDSEMEVTLEPPIEMVRHLGLLANSMEHFIANIIDMEQPLLLVNPKLSSNYDLVKMIATDENLELLEERLNIAIPEFKEKVLRSVDKEVFLGQQLALTDFQDVESLEYLLKETKIMDEALEMLSRVQLQEKVIEQGLNVVEETGKLLALVEFLGCLEKIHVEWVGDPVSMGGLEALRCLERIRFSVSKVVVQGQQVKTIWLDFSEAFKRAVAKVKVAEKQVSEKQVTVLLLLEEIAKQAERVRVVDEKELRNLEKQFQESGHLVVCPVWGEVMWDGKNCVVVNQ